MSDLEKRDSHEIMPVSSRVADHSATEANRRALSGAPPPFRWASLWEPAVVNPLNGKSFTFPILNLRDQYSINFHLAWFGFFVAFLSWFAFPPLIPEAIREDLHLTPAQIGNSNIVALCATLVCRFIFGPLVDRFGPRITMAIILILGAIPSGLAGTVTNVGGLYVIRFFIGILGATFVPCLAWTTAFYDKSIVGMANSFAGGWGNLGGGVTFVVQVAVFQSLTNDRGLSSSDAWRAAFAVVPVPLLLGTAIATLVFGTDHPAGKWSARHTLPSTAIAARQGHLASLDPAEREVIERKMREKQSGSAHVQAADDEIEESGAEIPLDVAVNEPLTWKKFVEMVCAPYIWLPALMYMTTFGFELAVDSNMPNVLFADHHSNGTDGRPAFGQLEAGYYTSVFGFLNIVTRPFGGYLADRLYARYGIKSKKYVTIALGFLQGAMSIGYGAYTLVKHQDGIRPSLSIQMGFVALMAIFCEVANGTNFSLVPHCNPFSNGFVTGLVGAFGNLGGIFFALMFRFHTTQGYAVAWLAAGAFAAGLNLLCILIPTPKQ
ncbi:uncharacterized protein JCM10292_000702 [Rhodotorula paludigena]|uniref:uncharacterized protein n=1 Tax=Rhodotorula paludigena TaxID=86838 RepID=UPI003178C225